MMSEEGAAFVERYRVAPGDSEAAVEKKARALATDLVRAFHPISKTGWSQRAFHVKLREERWEVGPLYRTEFNQFHTGKAGAIRLGTSNWTPDNKRYSCEVAAAFAADILQYEGAGAFGLANLNFPEFAPLYRNAPLTNKDEYQFRLDECKRMLKKN
jgi:hypothetical protein